MKYDYLSARDCGIDAVVNLLREGWELLEQISHPVCGWGMPLTYETEYRFRRPHE